MVLLSASVERFSVKYQNINFNKTATSIVLSMSVLNNDNNKLGRSGGWVNVMGTCWTNLWFCYQWKWHLIFWITNMQQNSEDCCLIVTKPILYYTILYNKVQNNKVRFTKNYLLYDKKYSFKIFFYMNGDRWTCKQFNPKWTNIVSMSFLSYQK